MIQDFEHHVGLTRAAEHTILASEEVAASTSAKSEDRLSNTERLFASLYGLTHRDRIRRLAAVLDGFDLDADDLASVLIVRLGLDLHALPHPETETREELFDGVRLVVGMLLGVVEESPFIAEMDDDDAIEGRFGQVIEAMHGAFGLGSL